MTNHELPIIVLASGNRGKIAELQQLVGNLATVKSAGELGVTLPEETGTTFVENAKLKSEACWEQTGHVSLADDSGLEVDALNGAPGVYSARYSGPTATDEENNQKLLSELANTADPDRSARFRCAIAITYGDALTEVFEGHVEGNVGFTGSGTGGFGYDPLFRLPGGLTMAEIPASEKNLISHRAVAMQKAMPFMQQLLAEGGAER